jgi:hypothetical protein
MGPGEDKEGRRAEEEQMCNEEREDVLKQNRDALHD